jgi:hypothetical protein
MFQLAISMLTERHYQVERIALSQHDISPEFSVRATFQNAEQFVFDHEVLPRCPQRIL